MAKKTTTTTTKATTEAKDTKVTTPAPEAKAPEAKAPEAPATTPEATPTPAPEAKPAKPAKPAKAPKVNYLDTVAGLLAKQSGVTFTHNTRNITVSNKATGKKLFEVWKRSTAVRVYAPANIADKAKGLIGAYNLATGLNGYPAGTLSVYYPAGNLDTVIPALVNAGLTAPAPAKATKATNANPAPSTTKNPEPAAK